MCGSSLSRFCFFVLFEGLWIWGVFFCGEWGVFWDGYGHGHTWRREVGEEVYQCQLRGCKMCDVFLWHVQVLLHVWACGQTCRGDSEGSKLCGRDRGHLVAGSKSFFAPSFFSFLHFPVSSMNFLC